MTVPAWMEHAACVDAPLDVFFPTSPTVVTGEASRLCRQCPYRTACLDFAIDNGIWEGIWGGLPEMGRRDVARKRGVPRHGTTTGYTKDGCHCHLCRAEMTERKRDSTERRAKAMA